MVDFVSIKNAKQMRSGINTKGTVITKGDPRTVNLKTGGTLDVCDCVISDGDGAENQMTLTLWGEEVVTTNIGDKLVFENAYTNSFRDKISLTKGKFGKMTKTQ